MGQPATKPSIKVGFCVAYDWELLKESLPRIYASADLICLSLDKNRKAWSGLAYTFDTESFYKWVRASDPEHKIDIYEDDFSLPHLSSLQNDNRQRTLMASRMGNGGWHIQLDCDEYFIDFAKFRSYLFAINPNPTGREKPINVCCNLVPLYKKLAEGYLYVRFPVYNQERVPIATNVPIYTAARRNGHFNHVSNSFLLHETWARDENELLHKIDSWGHDMDFDKQVYITLWKNSSIDTYMNLKNVHPTVPKAWPALGFCAGSTKEECFKSLTLHVKPLPYWYRIWLNSRIAGKIRQSLSLFLSTLKNTYL